MSPQILNKMKYTNKCDVWSFGLVIYKILHLQLPWGNNDQLEFIKKNG